MITTNRESALTNDVSVDEYYLHNAINRSALEVSDSTSLKFWTPNISGQNVVLVVYEDVGAKADSIRISLDELTNANTQYPITDTERDALHLAQGFGEVLLYGQDTKTGEELVATFIEWPFDDETIEFMGIQVSRITPLFVSSQLSTQVTAGNSVYLEGYDVLRIQSVIAGGDDLRCRHRQDRRARICQRGGSILMNYHEQFIIDFARRTRTNLEFIEAAEKKGQSVFEVTQLANSLLGLLVFPKERYIDSIPNAPLADLVSIGWPDIKTTHGQLRQDTLRELMRMLRNSIAHCNVEFIAETDSVITGIKVWNTSGSKKTWQAVLSLADLRAIAFKFIELIESSVEAA